MIDLTGALPRDPALHYCEEPHPLEPEVVCLREIEQGGTHMGHHSVPGTLNFWPGRGVIGKGEKDGIKEGVRDGIQRDPATPPPTSADVLPPRVSEDRVQMPHNPTDTQQGAGASTLPRSGTQRSRVYEAIRDAGAEGLTDEEIQHSLAMNPSTVRPRRGELVQADLVADSGQRRRTASRDLAIVWVLREHAPASTLPTSARPSGATG